MPDHIIQAKGFGKRYGRVTAVAGLNLTVQRGEIYGLIGPDGAGKSSLMKAVAGVLAYETGQLQVFDTVLDSESAAEQIKGRIGLMPQGLGQNLYGDLSIEENLDFFARLRLVPDEVAQQRKETLLRMTRLDRFRQRPMKQLSGGMKQKLGLICTLIHAPELVILDEPTTGVDPVSRRDFWAILAELLQEQGITALVSTAYMDEASRFHRMSLLHGGQVLATGTPEDIQQLARGHIVSMTGASRVRSAPLDTLRCAFPQYDLQGDAVRVFVDEADPQAALAAVAALTGPEHLTVAKPDLEAVFVALLRQQGKVDLTPRALPAGHDHRRDGVAIAANALSRQFGDFRAVDEVSFEVRPGEIFGLLGANGAGKTTVIKMLTGILPPTSGVGQVAGADMARAGRLIKERIGYMSQAFSLYLDLTVIENIRLYAGIYGLSGERARARVQWVLEMAGLDGVEGQLASSLPMGLRQRLALGCALVHEPQVLFLDEPTSGVDPIGRRQFWDMLFALARQQGVAILITTHYMSEAEHCDRIAMMYAGRIFADASPAQLKAALQSERGQLLALETRQPLLAFKALQQAGYHHCTLHGRQLHILTPEPSTVIAKLTTLLAAAGAEVIESAVCPVSMEDVFVERVLALEQEQGT